MSEVPVGARVRVHANVPEKTFKSGRARSLAGQTGTVIHVATQTSSTGQHKTWVALIMDDPTLIPAAWRDSNDLHQSVWVSDVDVIDDEPSDEEILALFNVNPHHHVCRECGMRME